MVYFPTLTTKINHSCRRIYQSHGSSVYELWLLNSDVPSNNTSNHTLCWQALDLGNPGGHGFWGCPKWWWNVRDKHVYKLPRELTTFIFRGYNPYFGSVKPFIFHGCGVQGYTLYRNILKPYIYKSKISWSQILFWYTGDQISTKQKTVESHEFHTNIHQFYEPKAGPLFSSVSALAMTCPFKKV